jgi:hypothetical protein
MDAEGTAGWDSVGPDVVVPNAWRETDAGKDAAAGCGAEAGWLADDVGWAIEVKTKAFENGTERGGDGAFVVKLTKAD